MLLVVREGELVDLMLGNAWEKLFEADCDVRLDRPHHPRCALFVSGERSIGAGGHHNHPMESDATAAGLPAIVRGNGIELAVSKRMACTQSCPA
jgi:hypothetical protein